MIDAQCMTIMPGLINSNQHIQLNPIYPAPTADLPMNELRARWEEMAKQLTYPSGREHRRSTG